MHLRSSKALSNCPDFISCFISISLTLSVLCFPSFSSLHITPAYPQRTVSVYSMYNTAHSAFPDGHESPSSELPGFTCQESRSNSHPSLEPWTLSKKKKNSRVHRELGHVHFLSFEDTTWKMNIINQGGEFTVFCECSSAPPWPIRRRDAAASQTQTNNDVTRE